MPFLSFSPQQDFSAPHLIHPSEFPGPSNDDIEAVIQMATSSSKTQDSRQLAPLRDTRAQLFVGNVWTSVDPPEF
jgi:hypothetical protein